MNIRKSYKQCNYCFKIHLKKSKETKTIKTLVFLSLSLFCPFCMVLNDYCFIPDRSFSQLAII